MMAETKNTKAFNNTEIPSDWEIKKVGDFGKVYTGNTPLTSEVDNYDGDFLFVSPGDLSEAKYIFKTEKTLSEKGFSGSRKFSKGAVLFTCIGSTIGKSGIATVDLTANQQINAIVVNGDNSNEYLYYQLERNVNRIKLIAGEQAVPIINKSQFETIKLLRAPLPEQKAIAQVLSKSDAAIHTTEKLIAQKELRKKWLMQQLLTGKKRLMGFEGEWKEIHIRDVAKEVSIRNKSDKQLTVLSCTKYDGLVPSLEYFGRKIFADDVSTYKIVPKNHFAYATNHIEEGSIGYQEILDEALISPMYTVFKTDKTVNDNFFYKLLKSHPLVYQYQNRMEGSIDRRGGLRWDGFSIIKIKLPSYEEQTAIAQVLQTADKEISLLKAKTEKLREQKKGLMQVLLTGKIRLKQDFQD
jgi:type I restriction enzyme S subunit